MGDIITTIGTFLTDLLSSLGMGPSAVEITIKIIVAAILGVFGIGLVIFTVWLERKVAGRIQDRLGPNRVGPYGIFQTVADAIKLLTKELITPAGADKVPYNIAPVFSVLGVLLIWAVVPFTTNAIASDLNVAVLYIVAVGAFGVLAVLMAGWSSNNKYALLGALRVVAQTISYEVPLVLSLLVPVMLAGTMSTQGIVEAQPIWYIVYVPVAAFVFFVSSLAEVGRPPFDLLEAESELVAGFHIEYSGMRFAMFFLAEFMHAFAISALTAVLFLGGWRGPWVQQYPTLGFVYLGIKTMVVYFVVMWVRCTVPRVRIDQMLNLNWKFLVPLSLVNVLMVAILGKLPLRLSEEQVAEVLQNTPWVEWAFGPEFMAELPRAVLFLLANAALVIVVLALLGVYARRERRKVEALVDAGEFSAPQPAAAHQ